MDKRDPYNHKQRFDHWLHSPAKNRIVGLNAVTGKLVVKFIMDFSVGLNISRMSKKGARSPARLNNLRQRLIFLLRQLAQRGYSQPSTITSEALHKLFADMRNGQLMTRAGTPYRSTRDYVKVFKTFWHWYMKADKGIEDITLDLDTRGEKPKFVYFTDQDFERIIAAASTDLKPLIALAFDSGMRVTELVNIRVGDFSAEFRELEIREETSKTFGRRIKLMLCADRIKEYVAKQNLRSDNFLARIHPSMINKELRRIGARVLSPEQTQYKNLTLYDFRHSSACYWVPRYKSESALKYRFGWKKSDMIHYYTEFLGMKDTITEDDLYMDITKTELEKQLKDALSRLATIEHQQSELAVLGDIIKRGKRSRRAIEDDGRDLGIFKDTRTSASNRQGVGS